MGPSFSNHHNRQSPSLMENHEHRKKKIVQERVSRNIISMFSIPKPKGISCFHEQVIKDTHPNKLLMEKTVFSFYTNKVFLLSSVLKSSSSYHAFTCLVLCCICKMPILANHMIKFS